MHALRCIWWAAVEEPGVDSQVNALHCFMRNNMYVSRASSNERTVWALEPSLYSYTYAYVPSMQLDYF